MIGKFPILEPGCEPFYYESCTRASGTGTMSGYFTFTDDQNVPFRVVVPTFSLEASDMTF